MEVEALTTATSALNLVVKIATAAITNKLGLLLGVQDELFFIKDELEMMQAFLCAASTQQVKGKVVTTWIKQVQELAFDVEDCLQEASVHLMKKSCLPVMCSVKNHEHIACEIRSLKTRIEDVSKRNKRYELIKDNDGQTYHERASSMSMANVALLVGLDEPKRKLIELIMKGNGDVISLVGMGGLGKTTLAREVYGSQELRAMFEHFAWVTIQHPFNKEEFIKSLAKKIPANPDDNRLSDKLPKQTIKEKVTEYLKDKKYLIVLDDMSDESEWTKISHLLPMGNERRIIVTTRLRPLAESISHKGDIYVINELSEEYALDLFYKAVYKTPNYNLVIDDRESQDDLPKERKCNMNDGPSSTEITEEDSKVQKQQISNDITEEEDTEIKDDQPNETMCNIKYGPSSTEITEKESEVPKQCITITITTEMNRQANLIVNSCDRLPLAIVTIGSLLYTKPKTSVEWKAMHDHLSIELDKNRDLGVVKNVLTSSYDGMPYHLKPSLLYLSVFHNHKEIRRSRIIRRWMADGYVMGDRKRTAEVVAKDYFNELMGRSLIQPSEMSTIVNEDINRCNIHDIMYELILAKAMDESNVSLLEDEHLITMTDKVRHLVITGGPCTGDKVLEKVNLSHMRSLSIFGEVGDYLSYPRMKLVRVLDLEGTLNLNDEDLRSIGKLRHLKYLGLRGTKITKLPDSLGKLSELETLDIRNTNVLLLPAGLTKLHKLSYLRAGLDGYSLQPTPIEHYVDHIHDIFGNWEEKVNDKCSPTIQGMTRNILGIIKFVCLIPFYPLLSLETFLDSRIYHNSSGVRVPRGIGKLRSLNIIGVIDIGESKSLAKEMQNLTNLRKLAVCGFTEENGKTLGKVIDALKHLRSLFLEAEDDFGLRCCLDSVSSPPKYLQSLKLHSRLGELPDWISSLENLEKIHFKYTSLTGGIEAIGKLPNLKILHLLAYSTDNLKELCFGEGTFPMMQVMILEELSWLTLVSIEKTALKRLKQLKIRRCWEMKEDGVSGLEFLQQLKEMEVLPSYPQINNRFVRNMQEQLSNNPRKPVLRVIKE
ncbi:disease resistance protein PIK6-NP-like [Carex rostrata]